MPWFAPEFEALLAVAAAVLDDGGGLLEANAGFLRLARLAAPPPPGTSVTRCFIQPDFASLARATADVDGEIFRGPMTIGEPGGRNRRLRGRVWRLNGCLRVLAEFDVAALEQADELESVDDALLRLAHANLKQRQREAEIVALSMTDPLTGVGNRRRLDEALSQEIGRALDEGGKLSVIMADLDHFKQVNDLWGHEVGDRVLAACGELLRRHTRASDVVARFGGEEFIVLMPHMELAKAVATADRIRAAFAACRVEPLPDPVTASFGVAELAATEQGPTLLLRADKALYAAKEAGRNRVMVG